MGADERPELSTSSGLIERGLDGLDDVEDRRLQIGSKNLFLGGEMPIQGAGGFRSARRSLVLLAAQSQALDSQAAPLRVDQGIHALCKALVASEAGLGP